MYECGHVCFLQEAVTALLRMYSFMGGGLFCAIVGNILLVVSTATDYWMQYRLSGSFAHQGLWRYCMSGKCYMQTDSIAYWNATRAFMILSAMSCFAGIIAGILSFAHFSAFERFNRSFAAGIMFFISTLFVLLAMAIYTGVTVNFLGKRFGDWRFSWSYILGWVALLMTFFAGADTVESRLMSLFPSRNRNDQPQTAAGPVRTSMPRYQAQQSFGTWTSATRRRR
ncbi:hypothetical protein JZ751_024023 [Albula glossodonta]|uniref:Lens fiber membrane intrinsic protein n=2 Tax=Teleostei TaxID=32443 RepID=A0A8T2NFM8_9TELE|nr:hypothetical protein JZ751_024023 [Albula glossodonta]